MLAPQTVESAVYALGAYADSVLPFAPEHVGTAAAVVSLNDWGRLQPVLSLANDAGVPTFAKVEGVQDFDDVDTGRYRGAYRTAGVVLGQGENDVEALPERKVVVVGSTRLERLWNAPAVTPGSDVLINLNFTYNVLAESRDAWLQSIEAALRATGLRGLVSCHPAERTRTFSLPVAAKPFRYEITRAGVLVSRFSTVPFEAMARGVPFVYHNPHGERVPTFTEPLGAFPITLSVDELVRALLQANATRGDHREQAAAFFRRQVDVDPGRPSELRAADVICDYVSQSASMS
jgi:hypothetical protein